MTGVWILVAVLVVLAVVIGSLRIVREYERGVAFRLGRLRGPLGPGSSSSCRVSTSSCAFNCGR